MTLEPEMPSLDEREIPRTVGLPAAIHRWVLGIGLRTLARVIHAYPTQAEAIKKAADACNRTH